MKWLKKGTINERNQGHIVSIEVKFPNQNQAIIHVNTRYFIDLLILEQVKIIGQTTYIVSNFAPGFCQTHEFYILYIIINYHSHKDYKSMPKNTKAKI